MATHSSFLVPRRAAVYGIAQSQTRLKRQQQQQQQRSLGSETCGKTDFPDEWGSWLDRLVRKGEVIRRFLYKGHDVLAEFQIIISIAKKSCQVETI